MIKFLKTKAMYLWHWWNGWFIQPKFEQLTLNFEQKEGEK